MGRKRHGRRKAIAAELRLSSWLAKGGLEKAQKVLAQRTTTVMPAKYPAQFVGAPTNATKVTEKMAQLFPGLIPTAEGRFLVPTPSETLALQPLHPPYLIGRFDRIVKESVQRSLMLAWDEFVKLDVRFPKADPHRSKTPALHLGVWELYASNPRITGDSTNQNDDVVKAMDRFLGIVNNCIAPKIFNILRSHYPRQLERQLMAYIRVMRHLSCC